MNINLVKALYINDGDLLAEIPLMGFILHDFSDLAQALFFALSGVYVYWKIRNEELKHRKMKQEHNDLLEESEDDIN